MQKEPRNSSFATPMRREASMTLARNRQIIVQEVARMRVVVINPPDPRRSQQHRLRPMLIEPAIDCRLVT